MDDSNSSNQINTSDLLALANEICNILNVNKEIESEKELFSDEVYIRIISNLILEEIKPGNTPEKKVENLNLLLSKLSKLIGADLSEINAEKIIIEQDKESVKHFLEFLFELINTIINSGEEFEEDEDNLMGKYNISDQNINKKKIKSSSFEDKNFNKDEEINIDDLESLRLSRDKKNDKKKNTNSKKNENEESEEMKIENLGLDKEKSQSEENLIFDKDNKNENKSNSKIMNVSHISDEVKNKKDLEVEEEHVIGNNDLDNENELNEIPALLKGDEEKSKKKKDIKNIENEFNNEYLDNDEEEYSKKKFEENKYNFQGSDDDLSSNFKEMANSVGLPYNKPLLTNNNSSEEYGDSLLKKDKNKNNKKDKDEDDFDLNYNDELVEKNLNIDKNSNTSLLNSNISLHSKKSKKSNRIDSKFKDSSNKKSSAQKKDSILGGNKISNNPSSKKETKTNQSKNDLDNENDISESQSNDISKSSVYTIHQKSVASSRSKKSKDSQKQKSNKDVNKSANSKKSSAKEKVKTKSSYSTIMNSEIPLDDQGFKNELIKELKKIYGNKIDKVLQGPNNSYSNLDLIVQDLKLINRQENLRKKIEQNPDKDKDKISIDEDGLLSKEFLIKYEKQLQLMLQSYNQKFKKRQSEQERYVREIGQNVQFMRKMRELELKKTENEIERKKQMYVNNAPEINYFCQKVWETNYQLEAEKSVKEIDSIKMINNMKLEEKTKNIYDIERYYRDKIAILNEIGRRERKEKKRCKAEDDLIYYQLSSIPKKELKRKIKQIINSIDDDYYNNEEDDNNNEEEIEKILDNYYKK